MKKKAIHPIGIFDSGFGGLKTFKEIQTLLPQYDYVYLGDSGRTPYGGRSQDVIQKYTEQGVNELWKRGCNLIILACNTASAQALRHIQQMYLTKPEYHGKKVLGVTIPIAEAAIKMSRYGRIGVVATKATVASASFEKELKKLKTDVCVYSQACPLLVPFVEEGWHEKPEARMILKKYLRPLKSANIDTLILGCTHYSFMLKDFKRIMGKNVKVINDGKVVAQSLKEYIRRHPELEITQNSTQEFLTTNDPRHFQEIGQGFLSLKMSQITKVEL